MLHIKRVARALKGNAIRQVRILSGIKARPKAPVLAQSLENIVRSILWTPPANVVQFPQQEAVG